MRRAVSMAGSSGVPLARYASSETESAGARGGRCLVGQVSQDGFGHQLESKLNCYAAALLVPGAEYVHVPFKGIAHGEDVREFERLMGFGRFFRTLNRSNPGGLRQRLRAPSPSSAWPFKRPCRYCMNRGNLSDTCRGSFHRPSWLRRAELEAGFRAATCCSHDVFVADNCCAHPQTRLKPALPATRSCVVRDPTSPPRTPQKSHITR